MVQQQLKTGSLVDALLIIGFDRLRAVVELCDEPEGRARLRACGLRYREFALANPNFYAIMFDDAVPHGLNSPEVGQHAEAAFGALVRLVELTAATGTISAPRPGRGGPADLEQRARRCRA